MDHPSKHGQSTAESTKKLRVLIVEDEANDAELTVLHLLERGYDLDWLRVDTANGMAEALDSSWDIIFSDYNLPHFSAPDALSMLNETGFDIPFVIISGTISADKAAPLMKAGAKDFVVKGDLGRLVPIIEREIKEAIGRKERAEIERRAKESDERFRLFVAGVSDYAIVMLDPKGNIINWNLGAERLFGYREEEVLYGSMATFFLPEAVEQEIPRRNLEVAATEGSMEEERWYIRKEGSRFWASSLLTALYDEKSSLRGFSSIMRDLTARKQAEIELRARAEQLKEQKDRLSRSNAELERYAYVASHDLKEPLRMISMYLKLLREQTHVDLVGKEGKQYIDKAIDGAGRMRSLIDDLLGFSRLEAKLLHLTDVDCTKLVEEVIADVQDQTQGLGAVITKTKLPTLRADAMQVHQLFQNLISNALKFSAPKAPKVHIAAVDKGEWWQFEIKDNGIGIDPENLEKIFVIFQRLHADRSKYPGTGIGLAICKKIIDKHRGHMWVHSTPHQGSSFYFTLPKKTDHH